MEGDAFQAPRFVVENLNIVPGVADRGNALEVGGGVADVLGSGALDGGDSGGAKAEVIVSDPIAFVVAGAFSGEGVVGGLVMFVACGGENFFTKREHFGVEIRVVREAAGLELFEEGCVFFVSEIVGREVIGLEGQSLCQGVLPVEEGLAGDGEDEVDIDFQVGGLPE